MPTAPVSINLDTEVMERLQEEAKRVERPTSSIVQEAIEDYLDSKGDRRRMLREAKEELAKGVFVSEEAVTAWLESWGTDNELPMPDPNIFPKKESA